jgi:small-conductance mechanosensitive channel
MSGIIVKCKYLKLRRKILIFISIFLFSISLTSKAEDIELSNNITNKEDESNKKRISTLKTISEVKESLQQEIKQLSRQLSAKMSAVQKKIITNKLDRLSQDLTNNEESFEQIATGLNSTLTADVSTKKFSLQDDIGTLIQPIVKEMKHMTSSIRQKSHLREEKMYYAEKGIKSGQAIENLTFIIANAEDKTLKKELKRLEEKWQRRKKQDNSHFQAADLQLQTLEDASEKASLIENSQTYFKEFIRKRGLYLSLGLLSILGVLLLSRFIHKYIIRRFPGFKTRNRSFRIRLIDLIYRILTIVGSIMAPMLVFYVAEDWLLFSLTVLVLFGLAWTLKYTVPKMWQQMLLILNVGPVREGERIMLNGLPWRVKHLNFYSELENPISDMRVRVPIEILVGKISRPVTKGEPWFPCKKSDWVILSDGVRGKVVGLSQEMVELVERGGSRVNYQMQDFLSLSPCNISQSFRLKETIGISYNLQEKSTSSILETLKIHLMEQIILEGYQDDLMNLSVEFGYASASSLDIVILADFKGNQAPIYNRIRRSIQRWCVDACRINNWEIPFTQIVMHHAN